MFLIAGCKKSPDRKKAVKYINVATANQQILY